MTAQLVALCFDAHDPPRLARFWGDLLGWARADDDVALVPSDDTGFRIRFVPTTVPKTQQNPIHLELTSSSLDAQQQTVATALSLGARHIDIGQLPEEGHVVLADPEGNELCVIEPGNQFLADCGFVGALSCDGSQEVGACRRGRRFPIDDREERSGPARVVVKDHVTLQLGALPKQEAVPRQRIAESPAEIGRVADMADAAIAPDSLDQARHLAWAGGACDRN